jgi:hypothetical protein
LFYAENSLWTQLVPKLEKSQIEKSRKLVGESQDIENKEVAK